MHPFTTNVGGSSHDTKYSTGSKLFRSKQFFMFKCWHVRKIEAEFSYFSTVNQSQNELSFKRCSSNFNKIRRKTLLTKTRNDLKPAKTTWNQPYYSIFHLKQVILRLSLSLYSTLKSLLGKSGLKIWNSPDWLRFGTGVHCYILISI